MTLPINHLRATLDRLVPKYGQWEFLACAKVPEYRERWAAIVRLNGQQYDMTCRSASCDDWIVTQGNESAFSRIDWLANELNGHTRDEAGNLAPAKRTVGDFDVWYQPCEHCGYDTAKSRKLDDPRCWKCGRPIQRDYSDRALKSRRVDSPMMESNDKVAM